MASTLALVVSLVVGLNLFLLLVVLTLFNHLRKEIRMFKDDVVVALGTQGTAIDNLAARLPAPVDPATVVPLTDQTDIVSGIAANTAKIDALAPKA